MIDLTPFCREDHYRENLRKPFSYSGNTYAGDTVTILRVPFRAEIAMMKEGAFTESLLALPWPKFKDQMFTLDLPAFPAEELVSCEMCDGTGIDGDDETCFDCKGTCKVPKPITVRIGARVFNYYRLKPIFELPNLLITDGAHELTPLYFRFDGGDGLTMALRTAVNKYEDAIVIPMKEAAQ